MPPSRSWRERLRDIIGAIDHIQTFTAGLSYEDFAADALRTHAVRHDFGIIGEAARYVPAEVQARYPEVAWREALRMRNFVVHVYWAVSDAVVWKTIQEDLPILKQQIEAILAAGDDG